jgi:hypothetical protein
MVEIWHGMEVAENDVYCMALYVAVMNHGVFILFIGADIHTVSM